MSTYLSSGPELQSSADAPLPPLLPTRRHWDRFALSCGLFLLVAAGPGLAQTQSVFSAPEVEHIVYSYPNTHPNLLSKTLTVVSGSATYVVASGTTPLYGNARLETTSPVEVKYREVWTACITN